MNRLKITVGPLSFIGELQTQAAPATCSAFLTLLPFRQKLIQARWSGESAWIPLGDFQMNVGPENQKTNPAPGELLFYPAGVSETEILFPYGATCFASKMGQLAGNHFLTIIEGRENLPALGKLVLWHGAQEIVFLEG